MEVQEFGKQNSRKIMLLPGNMMSWRQFEAVIPLLEKQYHVIAVSTDGYDDTGKTTFTTAEAMAEKLEQYIKEEQDGAIDLISLLCKAGLVTSRSEGRRAIEQGGVSVDGEKITDIRYNVKKEDITEEGLIVKRGKKKFMKICL